jgi:hypothetical protein
VLGEALEMENSTGSIFENMMIEYSNLITNNEVANYNFKRMYINL